MSRRITFKVYSKDAVGNPIDEEKLALAFQRHCQQNLGVNDDLNMLAKKIFMKFLMDSVDRKASNPTDLEKAGVADDKGIAEGDSGTDAVASSSIAGTDALDTQAVSGEAAPA